MPIQTVNRGNQRVENRLNNSRTNNFSCLHYICLDYYQSNKHTNINQHTERLRRVPSPKGIIPRLSHQIYNFSVIIVIDKKL